jgi:hypothetical protein
MSDAAIPSERVVQRSVVVGIRTLLVGREHRPCWPVSGRPVVTFAVATFLFVAIDCSPLERWRCAALEGAGRLSAIHVGPPQVDAEDLMVEPDRILAG